MLMNFDLVLWKAILVSLGLAVLFVTSLYIWPQKYHRNHPTCVKQRMFSALLITILSPCYLILFGDTSSEHYRLLDWIGIRDPLSALIPLSLTLLLFSGPLYLQYELKEGLLSDYSSYSDVVLIRNLIVAPITEEIVFRSCLGPLLFKPLGWTATVIAQPLFFGVAHLHHGFELYRRGTPLLQVLATVLVQTAFTSAFGAFSTLTFLTTGSVIGPILCHSFCNCMGFPNLDSISDTSCPKVTWGVYLLGLVGFVVLTPYLLTCQSFSSLYCYI
ncbi:CAAX prenyl protease 2-like [Bolinopsis microptera]|uniref:CAAX prenyl protease 2-like n=1 Tax=Bolinopsis microptera TaxID=2820187 RepID=UPI003078E440